MKYIIILILVLCTKLSSAQLTSPQVTISAGHSLSNGFVILDGTIGELMIFTYTTNSIVLTQGFQQPRYDLISSVFNGDKDVNIRVYPNPSNSVLQIELLGEKNSDAKLMILDMLGKEICEYDLIYNQTNIIDITLLKTGQYLFRIADIPGQILSTHLIQKND